MGKIVWRVCRQVAVVYETADYSMFHEMQYNRDVTEKRVAKLVASFSEKEIMNPIVVNERCEIVDGQGRYEALKQMGRPIKFVVAYGANIDDCRRMNIYNTNWGWGDYINSYVKAGNENYIRLQKCADESGYSYKMIIRLAEAATDGGEPTAACYIIPQGKLVFTEEHVERFKEAAKKLFEIKVALTLPRLNETLIKALKVCFDTDGYDHKRMVRKCEYCRSSFKQMNSMEDMLIELSRIYNYKSSKEHLYFEDYMRNKGYNVKSYINNGKGLIDISKNVKSLKPTNELF